MPVIFKPGYGYKAGANKKLPAIKFKEVFENNHPVEVEIGCGKGRFLVERAQMDQKINFLGVDIAGKWMKMGDKKREKRNLLNLKFMKTEMRVLLPRIPKKSVSIFHIYFPDPWPKKRHHKRRLINATFLRVLHEKLVPDGFIEIASDDLPYFKAMKAAVKESEIEWKQIKKAKNRRIHHPEIKTNYEVKWEDEGRDLYYLELQK